MRDRWDIAAEAIRQLHEEELGAMYQPSFPPADRISPDLQKQYAQYQQILGAFQLNRRHDAEVERYAKLVNVVSRQLELVGDPSIDKDTKTRVVTRWQARLSLHARSADPTNEHPEDKLHPFVINALHTAITIGWMHEIHPRPELTVIRGGAGSASKNKDFSPAIISKRQPARR